MATDPERTKLEQFMDDGLSVEQREIKSIADRLIMRASYFSAVGILMSLVGENPTEAWEERIYELCRPLEERMIEGAKKFGKSLDLHNILSEEQQHSLTEKFANYYCELADEYLAMDMSDQTERFLLVAGGFSRLKKELEESGQKSP